MISLAGVVLLVGMAAEEVPPVPAAVLAAAAAASESKPVTPVVPVPSPETLALADRVDVLLLASETLLAKQEIATAGQRFVEAVQLMESLEKPAKRSLGERYRAQRRQMTVLAQRLLADPQVAAALGDAPLVPTPAEERQIMEKPGL
jgi:hypothetical protein